MMTNLSRFNQPAIIAGLLLSVGMLSHAQDRAPFPTLSDKRVYVAGVPDRYEALAGQINQLERSSPQSYYVVVLDSSGRGSTATHDYADQLFERWRNQAAQSRRSFDPDRSVLIVAALDNRQVAVHPGATLREKFGLTATI